MKPAPLLVVLLPLLFGGCGEKESVAEVKAVEEKQQEVTPEEPVAETKPAEAVSVSPHLKYEVEDDAVTIIGCDKKASGALIIPATIKGKSVISIGKGAFRNCNSLTSITVPDSVTSIGRAAFFMCPNLTSITIGDGVTSIGDYAFSQCHSLTTIEVGAGNKNFTDVNGVLFNAEKAVLLTHPGGKTGDNYDIPDSVTSIGNGAFSGCAGLTSIEIPDGVTSIGEQAFHDCTSLTSIEIPDSVTSIGDFAFKDCTRLTSITIGDGVTSIGDYAFPGCNNLTSITIPENVTSIGNHAFFRCSSLTSITIPEGVTSIGELAFFGCKSLTAVTFLGDTPKAGEQVFQYATPTIYRKPEAKGWGDTFAGRPVKLISEKP